MQIESILIFVAFVIISSLANKRKQAQQQQRQQQKQQLDQKPQQIRQQQPKQQQKSSSAAQRPKKRTLQDLFLEMQQGMEAEYRRTTESEKKPPAETKPFAREATGNVAAPQMLQKTAKRMPAEPTKAQKEKSPIYADEIKDKPNGIDIDLTEENILNGIIFSEILGKPISLRS